MLGGEIGIIVSLAAAAMAVSREKALSRKASGRNRSVCISLQKSAACASVGSVLIGCRRFRRSSRGNDSMHRPLAAFAVLLAITLPIAFVSSVLPVGVATSH